MELLQLEDLTKEYQDVDKCDGEIVWIFSNGGKTRPVLIWKREKGRVYFLSITTKYKENFATQYFEIRGLKPAGLKRQSWVDLGNLRSLPTGMFLENKSGYLTDIDYARFEKAVKRFYESQHQAFKYETA